MLGSDRIRTLFLRGYRIKGRASSFHGYIGLRFVPSPRPCADRRHGRDRRDIYGCPDRAPGRATASVRHAVLARHQHVAGRQQSLTPGAAQLVRAELPDGQGSFQTLGRDFHGLDQGPAIAGEAAILEHRLGQGRRLLAIGHRQDLLRPADEGVGACGAGD